MKKKHTDEVLFYEGGEHKHTKIAIIAARWNEQIIESLYESAKLTLHRHGVTEITTHWVPGSYELPQAANLVLQHRSVDAVICLGCVIQGETRHFEFICQSVSYAIQQASLKHNRPVIFGVLTTDNPKQAKERAGGKYGNKGAEAAIAALKMIDLQKHLIP